LSYTAGFIDGVKIEFVDGVKVDRKEEDVHRILQQVKRIDMDAPATWKVEYNKLFDTEYPYIQKLSESYHLPLGDLMNFQPDEPIPRDKTVPSKETPSVPSVGQTSKPEADLKKAP
jgi:hypothetical protein